MIFIVLLPEIGYNLGNILEESRESYARTQSSRFAGNPDSGCPG